MAGAGIALNITIDDREIVAGLAVLAGVDRPGALSPAWDAIGEAMVSKTQARFIAGHGPDGSPWVPSQRALKTGGKTLIDTARLYSSMVHNVIANGVEWGTNVVYAAIHQFGGTFTVFARSQRIFRKVNKKGELQPGFVKQSKSNFVSWATMGEHQMVMPARPYLGIDADDVAEAENMLALELNRQIVANAKGFTDGAALP